METLNTVSILWDACLRSDFEKTSFVKVPLCNGVYFNNIYSHAGDTLTALTSFLTGYDCFGHGVSDLYRPLMDGGNSTYPKARAFPTLPMLLKEKGLHTFLVGEDSLWLYLGYDWIVSAKDLTNQAMFDKDRLNLDIIKELDQPFFLHIHLWSAHIRGKVDSDSSVETFSDKTLNVVKLDGYLRLFLSTLLSSFPNTQVLLWADHGDTTNPSGDMRHARILSEEVQSTWCLYYNPAFTNMRVDNDIHAQSDLFRLVTDTYGIEDEEFIIRYAANPLSTKRDTVYAGHWGSDSVAIYPEGISGKVDDMAESNPQFKEHLSLYGHMMPMGFIPQGSADQWPHEKVTERLKALGYID